MNEEELRKEAIRVITSATENEEKIVQVIYEKKRDQYSIRIPRAFAKAVGLDPEADKFKFVLVAPRKEKIGKELPELKGELVHSAEAQT